MDNSYIKFYRKLEEKKKENGFTYRWLAGKCGVSNNTLRISINKLKSGEGATPKMIHRISEVLGIKF